ncbi:MAG: serine/threonine-protein kinase [Casimicrobium sp.]
MTSHTSDRYPDALPVGTALGEFTITGVIGEGGFGTVYLAYEATLDRTVAIKEYLPVAIAARSGDHTVLVRSDGNREAYAAGLQSFMREARLQARFSHPAMLEVYRVWEQNGTAYMAMRYYPGESLRDVRRSTASSITIDEAWIKRILLPVFDAVRELHSQNVLHRDVSPDNILILPSGAPVLLDFGAARMVVTGAAQSLTTVLKPGYAPIEQYAGDGAMEQGPWTDVYGLGAVLYFLAIGAPPPQAVKRMIADTLGGFDESVSSRYSDAFSSAVKGALAVRPENRLQSVSELIAALGWDDAPVLPFPQTTTVTTKFANVAAVKADEARTAMRDERPHSMADGGVSASTSAVRFSGASQSTDAEHATPAPVASQSGSAIAEVPFSSAEPLPSPQPTLEASGGILRIGGWLLASMLLVGGGYFAFDKFRHVEPTPPVMRTDTEASPVNPIAPAPPSPSPALIEKPAAPPIEGKNNPAATAEGVKTGVTVGTTNGATSHPNAGSTPTRPIAEAPKSRARLATPSPPPKAKPAAGGEVPAARAGCERIFAKLSLGTAELTEVERQKLTACK